ncbi:MAG: antibiotic biosynthesis monooxygenase [Pseudonocardiaceae bacterium]|jgi:quinol monooxygenase YgiN|nr:antibiotic biosynthesis monooxygenase [Pseudonocardiaceae bacterium]
MSELLVIATHTMTAGKEDEVLAILPRLVDAARSEPGNISFTAHRESTHFTELLLGEIVPGSTTGSSR